MSERGEIRNRERAGQLIDFRGLRFNRITPTDIDGFIDFGNELFVVLEYKCGGAPLPQGQRLALERYASAAKVPCYVLIGEHENTSGDIDGANSHLREYWNGCAWRAPKTDLTIKQAVDILCEHHANRR
jgi:hypothetical protein